MKSSLLLVFFLMLGQCAQGLRILLVPSDIPSHVSMNVHVADIMISRGHDVTLVLPETFPIGVVTPNQKLKVERYKYDRQHYLLEEEWQQSALTVALNGSTWEMYDWLMREVEDHLYTCECPLKDQKFIGRLTNKKFDIALIDMIPCMGWLPYKLKIPFSVLGFGCFEPRLPLLPSIIPFFTTSFSDRMSFSERLINFLLTWYAELDYSLQPVEKFKRWIQEEDKIDQQEFYSRIDACFMLREHVTDFPRPKPPHHFYMGSILGRDAKPLPKDLSSFVEDAKDGIIVVTFGTWLDKLPQSLLNTLMEAFRGLKQRVIMRYRGDEQIDIPQNVLLLKWLPQNDLLGHAKTRMVIHHGGVNTLQEAAYHGVPSIFIPIIIDQRHNAAIAKSKGYGLFLEVKTIKAETLRQAIDHVLTDSVIKEAAKNVSNILKSKRQATLTEFEYMLQYLHKYGKQYLKSKAHYEIPMYQLHNEDVKVFIFVCIAVVAYVVYKCVRYICFGLFCRKSRNKSKQE